MDQLEEKIADLASSMSSLTQIVMGIKEDTSQTKKILNGNGSEGLVTREALNAQSIKRIWWWVGGLSLFLASGAVGLGFYVIKQGIES
jgi:hypothetical protein